MDYNAFIVQLTWREVNGVFFATDEKWKIDSKECLVKNQEQKSATWHKYKRIVTKGGYWGSGYGA